MKVGNENANHMLKILYANNHFEPIITSDPMINSSNIRTCDAYDTKSKNHNINNEINEVQHRQKRFNWNFESNKNLLEIINIHLKWLPQDIALVFIQNIHVWVKHITN
jgi:hypothetical protein